MDIVINEQLTNRFGHKCLKEEHNDSPLPCEFVQTEYQCVDQVELGLECVLCGYEITPDKITGAYGDINLDQYGD